MTRPIADIANGLTEAQRRKVAKRGFLLLPTDLSWRRAYQIERHGFGSIYPFHQRWQGRIDMPALRAHLEKNP